MAIVTQGSKHGLVNLVTVGLAAPVQTYRWVSMATGQPQTSTSVTWRPSHRNTHDEKELIRLLQQHNSSEPFVIHGLRAQYNKPGRHIDILYGADLV